MSSIVSTSQKPDIRIALIVGDTSVGMSNENLSRGLEPFSQVAEDNLVYAAEGTGLGLPLTAALARLRGAGLVTDSVKSVGTTVAVRYPQERLVWADIGLTA